MDKSSKMNTENHSPVSGSIKQLSQKQVTLKWLNTLIKGAEEWKKQRLRKTWFPMAIAAVLFGIAGAGIRLAGWKQETGVVGLISLFVLAEGVFCFQQICLLWQRPEKSYLRAAEKIAEGSAELLQNIFEEPPEFTAQLKDGKLYLIKDYFIRQYFSVSQLGCLEITPLSAFAKLKAVRYTADGHIPGYRLNYFNSLHQIVKTDYFKKEKELELLIEAVKIRHPELLEDCRIEWKQEL